MNVPRWIHSYLCRTVRLYGHGAPISIKLLHVLIGFMISKNLIIKRTDPPLLTKKKKYAQNDFARLESKRYFYCAEIKTLLLTNTAYAIDCAYFVLEVGKAEKQKGEIRPSGGSGEVRLICVCRRALPPSPFVIRLAFYSGDLMTFFICCLREW